MDNKLEGLIENAQSTDEIIYQNALLDLRLVIERQTQNRYEKEEEDSYWLLFSDKTLITYRLSPKDLIIVKYFLFYVLFPASGASMQG
jgi:hypothetical protein